MHACINLVFSKEPLMMRHAGLNTQGKKEISRIKKANTPFGYK